MASSPETNHFVTEMSLYWGLKFDYKAIEFKPVKLETS